MKVRAVLFGILLLTTTPPLGAGERLTLKVSPAVAFAPANLIVRATILADADNRAVEIIAESDDFYRSSEIQLEGEKAARTNMFEFRSLPPGTYEVRASLVGESVGAPDMPSALVEIGCLSNPDEEMLLPTPSHQRRLAQTLLRAIDDYFAGLIRT